MWIAVMARLPGSIPDLLARPPHPPNGGNYGRVRPEQAPVGVYGSTNELAVHLRTRKRLFSMIRNFGR